MNKKLDIEKVDAALKRAARTAVTGSREARSGRFVPRKQDRRPKVTDPKHEQKH
jgi:hypothetical protein